MNLFSTKSIAGEEIVEFRIHAEHHSNYAKIAGDPSIHGQCDNVHKTNVKHEGIARIGNVLINGEHAGNIEELEIDKLHYGPRTLLHLLD